MKIYLYFLLKNVCLSSSGKFTSVFSWKIFLHRIHTPYLHMENVPLIFHQKIYLQQLYSLTEHVDITKSNFLLWQLYFNGHVYICVFKFAKFASIFYKKNCLLLENLSAFSARRYTCYFLMEKLSSYSVRNLTSVTCCLHSSLNKLMKKMLNLLFARLSPSAVRLIAGQHSQTWRQKRLIKCSKPRPIWTEQIWILTMSSVWEDLQQYHCIVQAQADTL